MGLVYYVLYVVASDVSGRGGAPVELAPLVNPSTALALFMVLGVAESVVPAAVGVASACCPRSGVLCVYCATNGGVISTAIAGYRMTIDLP